MDRRRLRRFDNQLGLRVAGSPEGVITPLMAGIRGRAARLGSSHARDPDVVEKVDNGAHRFEQVYESGVVESIRQEVAPYLEDDSRVRISTVDGLEATRYVTDEDVEVSRIEGVESLLEEDEVRYAVNSYFGSGFLSTGAAVFQYRHLPPEETRTGIRVRDWHLDTLIRPDVVRLLVFLSEDNSPLQVVPSRQTSRLLEDHAPGELEDHPGFVEENADIENYGGDQGDALLFNPRTQLHRAANPDRGETRTVLIFSLVPKVF